MKLSDALRVKVTNRDAASVSIDVLIPLNSVETLCALAHRRGLDVDSESFRLFLGDTLAAQLTGEDPTNTAQRLRESPAASMLRRALCLAVGPQTVADLCKALGKGQGSVAPLLRAAVGVGLAEQQYGSSSNGRPCWVYVPTKKALQITAADPQCSEQERAQTEGLLEQ